MKYLDRGNCLIIVALFLIASLVVICNHEPFERFIIQPDSGSYLIIGTHLAEGGNFSLNGVEATARREALYPSLIALFHFSGLIDANSREASDLWPLLLFQIILYISSLAMLSEIAKRTFNEKVAKLSIFITGFYIPISGMVLQVLSESLFIFNITACLFFFGKYLIHRFHTSLIFSALFLGLASLTKSITLLFPFILFLTLFFYKKPIFTSFVFLGLALVIPGLWTMRNHHALERIVISTTDGGSSLYRGNLIFGELVPAINDRIPKEVHEELKTKTAEEADAYLGQLAIRQIKDNPVAYLLKCSYKCFYLLFGEPTSLKTSLLFILRLATILFIFSRLVHYLLSEPPLFTGIFLFSLYSISLYSLIYTTPRYFAPALFLLMPLFSESLQHWFHQFFIKNKEAKQKNSLI